MKNRIKFAFVISFSLIFFYAAEDSCLDRWSEFYHSADKVRLTEWMKLTARTILYKDKNFIVPDIILPSPPECTGLFITLIRKGKVRGCYGAFSHMYNSPSEILKEYIKGALSLDPRHNPMERYELDETEIILTVTSNPEPVDDINTVDISNFGILIECEDMTKTVIVPAEYRTTSGVMKLTGNSSCRYYRFRCITIR